MSPRRENWGTYRREDGSIVTMIRGPRNRTWLEDEMGEIVSPVQSNIVPAIAWLYAETDWVSTNGPAWLDNGTRREVRANTTYRDAK